MSAIALSQWYASNGGPTRQRSRGSSFLLPPPGIGAGRLSLYDPIQQTVVVDVGGGHLGPLHPPNANPNGGPDEERKVRRRETVFGPDVGDDDQPGWTTSEEGNSVSVDVVRKWVERAKSEEGLHATTTLQALVNLKRPTLLLQPLSPSAIPVVEEDITAAGQSTARTALSPPLHVLKFKYDAMTPQVLVTISIHPTPPEGSTEHVGECEAPRIVYTGTHQGGFNQAFVLPAASALDLSSAIAPPPSREAEEHDDENKLAKTETADGAAAPRDSQSEDARSSMEPQAPQASSSPSLAAIPEFPNNQLHHEEQSRRFGGLFGRRTRQTHVEEGPIEMTPPAVPAPAADPSVAAATAAAAETNATKGKDKEAEHGMRVLIRIEAIGPDGQPLRRANAQLTHILITGTWVPDAGSTHHSGTGKRVWVVKVVRREAVIGTHSFLLKEIYGLSASSAAAEPATYPPGEADPYASTSNECIVCLTSPRDVVLLPCRHLVVCRECAVGMVEFGAGGRVARREEPEATEAGGAGAGAGVGAAADFPTAVGGLALAPPPPPAPTRRKKKAKGWYCPVCRQPYTSLLRLALPASKVEGGANSSAASPHPSRPGSIRSVRTTRTTRTTHSIAPTLPDGAEEMLSRLAPERPDGNDDADDDDVVPEAQRPQFADQPVTGAPNVVPASAPPASSAPTAPPPATAPEESNAHGVPHPAAVPDPVDAAPSTTPAAPAHP